MYYSPCLHETDIQKRYCNKRGVTVYRQPWIAFEGGNDVTNSNAVLPLMMLKIAITHKYVMQFVLFLQYENPKSESHAI